MASNQLSARELEELKKLYKQVDALTQSQAENMANQVQQIGNARQELERLRREYAAITSDITTSLSIFQQITQEISKQNLGINESKKGYKGLTSIAEKIQYHQKGISELSTKDIINLKTQIEKERQRLANAQELLRTKERDISAEIIAKEQIKQRTEAEINALTNRASLNSAEYKRLGRLLSLQDRQNRNIDDLNDKLLVTQTALSNNAAIIDGTDEGMRGLEATVEELNKNLSFTDKLIGKIENQLPGIGKALSGAAESFSKWGEGAFIISKLIEGFNSLNKAQVEFGRTTGKNIAHMDTLNMTLISSSDYIKTATELSKQFGVNADAIFTKETLQEAAEMVNLMGMSAEDAGKMARFTRISGVDLKASNISVGKQLESFNKTNRTGISLSSTLKDVANTSDDIALSLGGNPTKIALANAEARKLGLSLSQVDKIASSLLNFEDSISAELEAELLTGRQINLEQARLYALNNDIVGLTKEIGTNQDLINSFAGSNRIQQEAIAKSLGLGREEMAKMIYDQRNINGLSDEQLQKVMGVGSEELKRLSVQESINKSIEKMTEALAGPLEMLAQILTVGDNLKIVFGLIAGILAGRMVSSIVTSASSMAALVIAGKSYNSTLNQTASKEMAIAAARVAGSSAMSFGAAAAAALAGLAVVGGAIAAFASMKDGEINKFGKPTLFTGTDTVRIEPNDSIYAAKDGSMKVGTNLEKNTPKSSSTPAVSSTPEKIVIHTHVMLNEKEIAMAINEANLKTTVRPQ